MCFCIEQGQSSYCIQTDGVSAREELSASWRLKWTFARAHTHTHTHTDSDAAAHLRTAPRTKYTEACLNISITVALFSSQSMMKLVLRYSC